MYERGITPTVVENAVKSGKKSALQPNRTFDHIYDNVKVVVNEAGDVVTVHKLKKVR